MSDKLEEITSGAGILDMVHEVRSDSSVRVGVSRYFYVGEEVELLHDLQTPPIGRCKIVAGNAKDKIITFESVPHNARAGDLLAIASDKA